MNEQQGNIWTQIGKVDYLCVTTNLCTSGTQAIMGAGIAKECKLRYPDSPRVLAKALAQGKTYPVVIAEDSGTKILSFPTKPKYVKELKNLLPKYNNQSLPAPGWMGISDINLILESTQYIQRFYGTHKIAMPRPGCGHGGLDWNIVKIILERYITDTTTVWSL